MARHLDLDEAEFASRFTRRAEGRTALVDSAEGNCVFLRAGRCAVYAARPWQCRSWPFWHRNLRSREAWDRTGAVCPGIGKGREHATEEVREWLEGSPFLKKR